jgi:hypothetical protein
MYTTKSVYQTLPGEDAIEINNQKAIEILQGKSLVIMVPPTVISYDENQNAIATKSGWPDYESAAAWIAWVQESYSPISSEIIEE